MKLNRKGFTLIELLSVVVLLLAISTIAVSSISAAIERNKKKQDEAAQRVIVGYAELYYQQHKNSVSVGSCIMVQTLIDKGILTEDEAKDADGERFAGGVLVGANGSFTYSPDCAG